MGTQNIIEHLQIVLAPWLTGMIAGGGLGYVCALGIRALFARFPRLRRPGMLVPWRTIVMAFLPLPLLTVVMVYFLGIGPQAGAATVRLFAFLLAWPLTIGVFLAHWSPPPPAVRLVAEARTLAAASVVVAVIAGMFGGGGVGFRLFQYMQFLQWSRAFTVWLTLVALALVMDVLLGIVQMIVSHVAERARPDESP
ncbi:MAG: hypothetical protein KKA73_23885 [Chloroflexi bacterium]|nr:hypothetical protein [Chloroflexota bacterium]MBU1750733.1 hypothetical protein [Chloroflexota bacterium]